MRPSALLQGLLVLGTTVAALSEGLPARTSLIVRADDQAESSSSDQPSQTGSDSQSSETSAETSAKATDSKDKSDDDNGSGDNTAEPTSSGGKKASKTGSSSKDSKHTTFAADSPQGGVSMQVPATTATPTPLYKIGDHITFSWNYTSLLGKPSAVDVLLSCSTATSTWTLTSNMTFATSAKYVWDSEKQEKDPKQPLLVELYTLIVKDSDAQITDIASPGYLGVFSGLTMGLYTAQPYTSLADWECVGCNGGTSNSDRHFVVLALSMCLVTIFSFTWFVQGLDLQ